MIPNVSPALFLGTRKSCPWFTFRYSFLSTPGSIFCLFKPYMHNVFTHFFPKGGNLFIIQLGFLTKLIAVAAFIKRIFPRCLQNPNSQCNFSSLWPTSKQSWADTKGTHCQCTAICQFDLLLPGWHRIFLFDKRKIWLFGPEHLVWVRACKENSLFDGGCIAVSPH